MSGESRPLCRRSGSQCVSSIISAFVQRSGDPAVDMHFRRMSFDPHEVKTACGLQSQIGYKLGPHICIALGIQLSLTMQESSKNTHDILTDRPDLKVSFLHPHRGDLRQKFRNVVRFLTSRQGEGAIPVVTNAEEDSAARPPEPRILIADARTINPRPKAVVIQSFTIKSGVSKSILWQSIATDRQ